MNEITAANPKTVEIASNKTKRVNKEISSDEASILQCECSVP